jgi:2-keto-4-pentenoate hydratase/2-oxohepta-3-ene-1,7-dioic acid hydratase in catechol pathway
VRIAQFYEKDRIRIGLIQDESLVPFSFEGDMIDFIQHGHPPEAKDKSVSLDEVNWAPAVSSPSKIIALGLNYKDHAEESKGKLPEAPLIFAKFPNSLTGHGEEIVWDESVTAKVDYEAELAVIIGRTIHECPEKEALDGVFGYTCANDVSARDLQFGDGQWVRGKSLDTFCPLGPWVVTADEVPDPHSLKICCRLNGNTMQDSNTGLMIFRLPAIISFLSRHFTLFPGDVILTGTPSGVGTFRDPAIYLKNGDEVIVEIEGIGRLVNRCRTK